MQISLFESNIVATNSFNQNSISAKPSFINKVKYNSVSKHRQKLYY